MLIGAILLAAVAVYIAQVYVSRPVPVVQVAAAPNTVPVVVANTALAFGDKITPDKIRIAQFPPSGAPPGAFTTIAAVVGIGDRTVMRGIDPGEVLLPKSLSGKGGRMSASGLIGNNMRAITVPVSDISGVAGFLASGDRVDVFLTRVQKTTVAPFIDQTFTDSMMQDIRILAVGQDADEAKSKPEIVRTATLEVSPAQAQKLILAMSAGTLSLSLRGITDASRGVLRTVHLADLREGGGDGGEVHIRTVVRQHVVRPAGDSVEVVRGGKSEQYTMPVAG